MKETTDTSAGFARGGGDFLHNLWASVIATVVLIVICCGIYPLAVWAIAQGVFPKRANGSMVKKDGTPAKLSADGTTQPDAVGSTLIGQNFSAPGYFHPRPSAAGSGYDPTSSGGSNYGPLSDKLINGLPSTQPVANTGPTSRPAQFVAASYDGIRLRTLHYAVDNGLNFKLYRGPANAALEQRAVVPLTEYEDLQGNLNEELLVEQFPHPMTDAADQVVVAAGPFTAADGTPVLIPADAVTASASGLDPHISPANAALQAQRVADARKIPVKQVLDLIGQNTDGRDLGFLGDPGVNVLRLNLALDAGYPVPAAATTAAAK